MRNAKIVASEKKLKVAQDKARRRALGPPLRLSDSALDQAATVGDADAAVAESQWDRDVPELAGLLDAEVQES